MLDRNCGACLKHAPRWFRVVGASLVLAHPETGRDKALPLQIMPGQFEVMIERNFSSAHQLRAIKGSVRTCTAITIRSRSMRAAPS